MPSKRIIAAATRFKDAWDTSLKGGDGPLSLSDIDIVEMHEAALGLISATNTGSLQEALEALHTYERQ